MRQVVIMSGNLQPTKAQILKNLEAFKNVDTPEKKEEIYVHEVYNKISAHFSQTRYKPWPFVQQFLSELPDNLLGIDVGCGNGKYLNVNKKLYIVGSDYSTGLIQQARMLHKDEESNDILIADGLQLPHPDGIFDFALSIAVIHHFSTKERRENAIKEILRVLRFHGKALIYCWALEQEHSRRGYHDGMDQDVLVPWVLMKKQKKKKKNNISSIDKNKSEASDKKDCNTQNTESGDNVKPDTKMRYYHLYKKGELNEDCAEAGGKVVNSGYERDNWWTIVEKIK